MKSKTNKQTNKQTPPPKKKKKTEQAKTKNSIICPAACYVTGLFDLLAQLLHSFFLFFFCWHVGGGDLQTNFMGALSAATDTADSHICAIVTKACDLSKLFWQHCLK